MSVNGHSHTNETNWVVMEDLFSFKPCRFKSMIYNVVAALKHLTDWPTS